jgi:CheY-like chemotaxis protein
MATVLMVDDSPTVLKIMSVSLRAQGMMVRTAGTGAACLAEARREKPDCIVLDIHLPDISGLDLLLELKADPELRAIPVLLFTGHDDLSQVEVGMDRGAAGFLPKHSTSPKVLLSKLRSLLGPGGP